MGGILHVVFFITMVAGIYLGIQYYIAYWLVRNFPALPLSAHAVRLTVLCLSLSFPAAMILHRKVGGAVFDFLAYLALIWFGASFILLTLTFLGDMVWIGARLAGAGDGVRRALALGTLAAAGSLCLLSVWNARRPPLLREVEVRVRTLPAALDGYSIVQISDVHLGVTLPLKRFAAVIDRVRGLSPDLVVFTGDIVESGFKGEAELSVLGSSLKPPDGKLAVLGNHEFYAGLDDSLKRHKALGAKVLRNEILTLPNGLQIAGIDDIRTAGLGPPEIAKLLDKLDPRKPSILLSHQPLFAGLAADKGVGLMLSGHTHRGQIFPFQFVVRIFFRYVYGLHSIGDMQLYVTSGTMYWGPPMRLFAPHELVRIVLRTPKT